MRSSSRIPRWWLATACACAAMVLAVSQRALASGGAGAREVFSYAVTAPVNGYSVAAGSTIAVTWTSTSTSSNVNVELVDEDGWFVAHEIALNTADDGQQFFTIPADLPAGPYLIYIENVGITDWTFGSTFYIRSCGTSLLQQQQEAQPSRGRPDTTRPMPSLRPGARRPHDSGTLPPPRSPR